MSQNLNLDKLPLIKLLDKAKLPKIAGIYFVIDSNNRLLYIGKAQNIYQRWLNHHCNGICIVVGCDTGINYYIQNAHSTTLAGIFFLNLSDKDFQQCIVEKDWTQSYHPNIERYTNDLIPLLWTKDRIIEQPNVAEIKELNKKRTESKTNKGRTRGRQIKVYCEAIGRGKFVIKAYEEAIEWFGGCEILGLKKAEYRAWGIDNAPKWFKAHKVTVKIPEGDSYRSLSAPISASTNVELE